MRLDFSSLAPAEAYRWLAACVTPRPIAWVSSRSAAGRGNLAPFSFFQVVCDDPATLLINISTRADGSFKDTLVNLRETGELIVHLVDMAQAEAMNATAAVLPHGVSEFDQCGIASLPGEQVAVSRVAAAPVAFECRVAEIRPYPETAPSCHLIFARVLLAHIDERVLSDARHVDPLALDLIGRLSGSGYCTTRERFSMARP